MSAYTAAIAGLIFALGTVTGFTLAILPPVVTVTGLATIALAVVILVRRHLARWP